MSEYLIHIIVHKILLHVITVDKSQRWTYMYRRTQLIIIMIKWSVGKESKRTYWELVRVGQSKEPDTSCIPRVLVLCVCGGEGGIYRYTRTVLYMTVYHMAYARKHDVNGTALFVRYWKKSNCDTNAGKQVPNEQFVYKTVPHLCHFTSVQQPQLCYPKRVCIGYIKFYRSILNCMWSINVECDSMISWPLAKAYEYFKLINHQIIQNVSPINCSWPADLIVAGISQ